MTDEPSEAALARRREMATEHLLFGTVRFLAKRHPELLEELERSIGHVWDPARDGTRDDEAVRAIAQGFVNSLRREVER